MTSPETATRATNVPDWPFAKDKGSPLFKFKVFDPDHDADPEWQGSVASLLRDGLIYCASPWDLNDPWEARPAFAVPDSVTDPDGAEAFIAAICEIQPTAEQASSSRQWIEEVGFERACRDLQDLYWRQNLEHGVFSAAGNPVHPLLWSYYASGHRGYCWIFDHTITPLSNAVRVDYQPLLPVIDWARRSTMDITHLSHFVKADHWKHEDEYRLLLPTRDAHGRIPFVDYNGRRGPKPEGRYLRTPPDALIGVIFGGGLKDEYRQAIVKTAEKYGRRLEYNVAGIHRRKYEVQVRQVLQHELDQLRS